jgi:oxygen-independent coproporphyrinogen-3 oxidase
MNVANNALYIQSLQKDIIPFEETLTEIQQLNEYVMTSPRTMEGWTSNMYEKFGEEKSKEVEVRSMKYENTGKLKIKNRKIILTKEGKLFADGIAADLFF